uniref:Uncharacterized protein n=1 Tax=Vespula pensylvanica TaxID=30213 RepID=A0A834UH20_VESPE|nr:hypothetical protein H0235_001732 [Vespula pensylvanica]
MRVDDATCVVSRVAWTESIRQEEEEGRFVNSKRVHCVHPYFAVGTKAAAAAVAARCCRVAAAAAVAAAGAGAAAPG